MVVIFVMTVFFNFCNLLLLSVIPAAFLFVIFLGMYELPLRLLALYEIFKFEVPPFLRLWLAVGRLSIERRYVA